MFYQGARGWSHSTDLIPEAARSLPWVPRFTYELLDQTTLEPEAVAGYVKGRITQLLMMVAFDRHVDAALQLTENRPSAFNYTQTYGIMHACAPLPPRHSAHA